MIAKAGDVYCVYNKYLKKYTACQITKIEEDDKESKAVILSLDWMGDQPLKEEELSIECRCECTDKLYFRWKCYSLNG